ncbi:MAG: aminotransferase class IV [Mangrovibacterium sp.]
MLETIKLNNGILENLPYHNLRLNAARTELFSVKDTFQLEKEVLVPDEFKRGLYRCRITYGRTINQIEFSAISPRVFNHLKIIHHDRIDYHLKFTDRSLLNELLAQRENAEEIIIIKNGLVTDCTIGNLVFYNGTEWITPDTPLLRGTQRQALLDQHLITEKRINETELLSFKKVGIINAFFDLSNMPEIKIKNIF